MYQSCGALNRTSESVRASMSLCLPSDAGQAFLVWGEGEGWGGRAASRSFKGLRSAKEGSEMRGAGKVSRVRQYTAHVRARMRARDGGLSVRDISVSQLSAHTSRHATPHTHTTQDTRLERRGMSTARCAIISLHTRRRSTLACLGWRPRASRWALRGRSAGAGRLVPDETPTYESELSERT